MHQKRPGAASAGFAIGVGVLVMAACSSEKSASPVGSNVGGAGGDGTNEIAGDGGSTSSSGTGDDTAAAAGGLTDAGSASVGAGAGGASSGGVMETGAGAAGAGASSLNDCGPGVFGGGEQSLVAASVTAAIVDEKGTAVPNQPVYICGLDICSAPGKTGTDGRVTIQTTLLEKKPAFKFGDALNYAEFSIPLTAATTDFTSGNRTLVTGKLSDKPGAQLTPGNTAASGEVTITTRAGTQVSIDQLIYDSVDKQAFRAVRVPVAQVGPLFDSLAIGGATADFALLYGVAPAETLFCPRANVLVALPHESSDPYNDLGWLPGTSVEFWVTTVDTGQSYAPYASWTKMSDGVVSSDGASVATLPEQGFSYLDNFAIRKAE